MSDANPKMSETANPYQAPRSEISSGGPPPAPGIGWRIYACAVAVAQVMGFVVDLGGGRAIEILDDGVTLVGMVALLGYAFRRRFWRRRFWMVWAILFPLSNAAIGVWVYPRQSASGTRAGYFVAMLLLFPQYLAVIRYAYRSRALWIPEGEEGARKG
jgi:hypothetical protein